MSLTAFNRMRRLNKVNEMKPENIKEATEEINTNKAEVIEAEANEGKSDKKDKRKNV